MVSFLLQSMYESGSLLRSIVGVCPRLERMELACGHKPAFPLESFSKAIYHLRKLRSLSLTLIRFPGDNSLNNSAIRLALANPRLHHFTITFIPSNNITIPLPLPYPLVSHPYTYLESGTYTLETDEHGLPVSMGVVERVGLAGSWEFELGLKLRDVGFRFVRIMIMGIAGLWVSGSGKWAGSTPDVVVKRYKIDMRPRRCGWRADGGFMGWAWLLLEGSKAGEDLRMLVFLVLLFWTTLWGFFIFGEGRTGFFGSEIKRDVL